MPELVAWTEDIVVLAIADDEVAEAVEAADAEVSDEVGVVGTK